MSAMELDRGAKIVLQSFADDLLQLLFPDVEPGSPLGAEAITTQVISDRAFKGQGPDGDVVLHVEFEAQPTSDVGHRVTRTACGLYFAHGTPVRTSIVYLHPAVDGRRPKHSYRLPVGSTPVEVSFDVLVLWEDVRSEDVVGDACPGLLPFAGLAQGASLMTVRGASRAIEELPLPEHERADLQAALYLLSGYHFTSQDLLAIMSEEALMKSKTYISTIERGREEGRREIIIEMLCTRLESLEALEPRLAVASARDVTAIAELLAQPLAPEELRAKIERLLDTAC